MSKSVFQQDYYRMTGCKYKLSIHTLLQFLKNHNLQYMWLWRRNEVSPRFVWKMILFHYTRKYGLEISTSAKIGKGLYLGHPYNITVAADAILGDNVNLHKGCTIGRENRGCRMGVPTIGSCVSIGINATVVGKITIGNDVMIAPNSFVNFDVPDHSVVIGNPGSIHHKDNATQKYVNYCV